MTALVLAVLSPFLLAGLVPWAHAGLKHRAGWLLAVLPAILTAFFGSLMPLAASGAPASFRMPWMDSAGVMFSFRADGLALLFAVLISGIGTFILIYAGGYLKGHPHQGRMFVFLLLFMGSMLGVVLSDNLITLFVFWELTSLTSYLLIGFNHEQERSRRAALQALVVTGTGGLAMLAGFLLLGMAAGSMELSDIVGRGDQIRSAALYLPVLILVLLGAFTKSAQFPFHHWLPNAMEAPTPVSAYLHSATMVKAGVFLLARLSPVLGGTPEWKASLTVFGAATMLAGGTLALVKTDLKQLLAYSTVASLGFMVMLLGIGSPYAVKGCLVFLTAHALYKGALFMVAGAVDHETGTRDASVLRGLRSVMPFTAFAASLAGLAMAGLGPWLSFIGKELALEAVLGGGNLWLAAVAVLTSASFVAVAGVTGLRIFAGPRSAAPKKAHEAPVSMWIGPVWLAVKGALLGLMAGKAAAFVAPAVSSVLGRPEEVRLVLWLGVNAALGLSTLSIALGAAAYMGWDGLRTAGRLGDTILKWGPDRLYDLLLDAFTAFARGQTRVVQSGYLRYYLLAVVLSVMALAGHSLYTRGEPPVMVSSVPVTPYSAAVALMIIASAVAAVLLDTRLGAIAALGGAGGGVALIYVMYGAPDLAMTQFLVETLTIILFMLIIFKLPRFARLSRPWSRVRDGLISLAAGSMMAYLALVALHVDLHPPISSYFAENSVSAGFGRNVVNVILVDFRALDTLGEISVLGLAGLGVYAVLKLRLSGRKAP
ncbi:MAG: Na(+)/H(+) antiporter subunit A [Armatimonadota bacterium]|nr:MAG: Na(+)/H(+) antiporter subunit A [Armatimonadota bacterium]